MTRTIWVYDLGEKDYSIKVMPQDSVILSPGMKGDGVVIHALVLSRKETKLQYTEFRVYGTGYDIPNDIADLWCFAGTANENHGQFFWHVFYNHTTKEVYDKWTRK